MGTLIDSTLWVDYFRAKTPNAVKEQVVSVVNEPDAVLCHPVRFEILRAALRSERRLIEEAFATIPLVSSPPDLWEQSALLGQRCLDAGFRPPPIDLLIAQVSLHHDLEIATFDQHFSEVAKTCRLKVRLLVRAIPNPKSKI